MQIPEHGLAHQVGVKLGHPVHPVRADKSEMAHAQLAVAVLVDQRNGCQPIVKPFWILVFCGLDVLRIDPVDDLQMPRQDALEQVHRPGLERLGEEGVVGVGERADCDAPGIGPWQAMLVSQQSHQLCDRDAGVRIVELNRGPLRKKMQVAVGETMTRDQILQ